MFLLLDHIDLNHKMGGSASKKVSQQPHMKSSHTVPRSMGVMVSNINKKSEQMVSIVFNALESRGIMKNRRLNDLVRDFFSISCSMSSLCVSLEDCLKKAQDSQKNLCAAVRLFKEGNGDEANREYKYKRALEELEKFRNCENPFTLFPNVLLQVQKQQEDLVNRLKLHNKKSKKKKAILLTLRILTGFIFTSLTLFLAICEILALFTGMVHMLQPLGLLSVASGLMGFALDSQCKFYCDELKRGKNLVSSLDNRLLCEQPELGEIKIVVEELENQLESLMRNSNFTLGGDENIVVLQIGFEELEISMVRFDGTLKELAQCVETCSKDLKKGRLIIQNKIRATRF